MYEPNYKADRQAAQQWADALLDREDAYILDTETTGLGPRDEVCQLAVITMRGQTLLNTFVRPTCPIDPEASRIHKITDGWLSSQKIPTMADLAPQLREVLGGATVVIYNAAFDVRLLEQSMQAHGLAHEVPIFGVFDYQCAMLQYAQWVGEWSDYHGNYRYQKLPGGDHTALGDAQATLAVLKRMANRREVPVQILLTPEELELWSYSPRLPLAETLQAAVADLLRLGAGDTYRPSLLEDWLLLYRLDRGVFSSYWNNGKAVRDDVLRRVLLGRANDPWQRARQALASLRPGKQTKADLEAIIVAVREAMQATEREANDA